MAMSKGLSPNAVKTALDNVFYAAYDPKQSPSYGSVTDGGIFIQDTAKNSAVIEEAFKGVGLWTARTEQQDVMQDSAFLGNQKTHSVITFSKSVDIPKTYMDDDMHSTYEKMVTDMGLKARISQEDNGFGVLRGGFATYTTGDGSFLFSDTHTTLSGATVDNKSTAALSEAALNAAIVALLEQKDQSGEVMGNAPAVLVVPPALYKTACEIVKSELRAGTGNNDMNVYSSMYDIRVVQNNRLGAAAGGSDTAWFLLAKNHGLTRWVRKGIETLLVPYQFQRNNAYIYKGEFREVAGATDYVGLWGSAGV